MKGQYFGKLIGYRTYSKKNSEGTMSAPQHVYEVFCEGTEKNKNTGLFEDGCSVVTIIEDEEVLGGNLKAWQPVRFFGEMIMSKNGSFLRYTDIEAVTK